jgi:hypothetical protein
MREPENLSVAKKRKQRKENLDVIDAEIYETTFLFFVSIPNGSLHIMRQSIIPVSNSHSLSSPSTP